jgi:uncharacterized membrane protein
MHDHSRETLIPLALLSAASGARTFAGVAAVSPHSPVPVLAAGELIYDKVPTVPSRLDPASLLGRIAAGSLVGVVVGARTRRSRVRSAIVGGLVAYASAHATYRMRRALGRRLPAVAAALIEDVVVLGAAAAGAALLRRSTQSPGFQRAASRTDQRWIAQPSRKIHRTPARQN